MVSFARLMKFDTPIEPTTQDKLEQRIAQLEKQVRERDEFLSVVGHELRNPVSPLYMQIAVMTERVAGATTEIEKSWLLEQLGRLTSRLDRFVSSLDRLLDVSRIGEGIVDLRPEPCDIVEIVRTSVASFPELARLKISVTVDAPSSVRGVWDRLRLEQICGNLLSNAIRYGMSRPIAITIETVDNDVILSVRDQGIGIAAQELPSVFDKFRRAANARQATGLGIGLWVIAELCKAMNGSIKVTSELERGSVFTVRLPRGAHD